MKVKDIMFILNQLDPTYDIEFFANSEGIEFFPSWEDVWLAESKQSGKYYIISDYAESARDVGNNVIGKVEISYSEENEK